MSRNILGDRHAAVNGGRYGGLHATSECLRKTPHGGMLRPNTKFDGRDATPCSPADQTRYPSLVKVVKSDKTPPHAADRESCQPHTAASDFLTWLCRWRVAYPLLHASRMSSSGTVATILVVSILSSFGCSSTTTVGRADWPRMVEGVIRGNASPDAVIEFAGPANARDTGTIWKGRLLNVDRNALLLGERSGNAYRIPFEGTRSIRYTDRRKGFVDGLWIGAIPGAVGGVMLGSAAAGLCAGGGFAGDPNLHCNVAGTVAVTTLFGAALGAMVGAGIGLLVGHRTTLKSSSEDRYDFPSKMPDRLSEGSPCR